MQLEYDDLLYIIIFDSDDEWRYTMSQNEHVTSIADLYEDENYSIDDIYTYISPGKPLYALAEFMYKLREFHVEYKDDLKNDINIQPIVEKFFLTNFPFQQLLPLKKLVYYC